MPTKDKSVMLTVAAKLECPSVCKVEMSQVRCCSMAGQGGDVIYRSPEQPCCFGHSAGCGAAVSPFVFARRASFEFQPSVLRRPFGT